MVQHDPMARRHPMSDYKLNDYKAVARLREKIMKGRGVGIGAQPEAPEQQP